MYIYIAESEGEKEKENEKEIRLGYWVTFNVTVRTLTAPSPHWTTTQSKNQIDCRPDTFYPCGLYYSNAQPKSTGQTYIGIYIWSIIFMWSDHCRQQSNTGNCVHVNLFCIYIIHYTVRPEHVYYNIHMNVYCCHVGEVKPRFQRILCANIFLVSISIVCM